MLTTRLITWDLNFTAKGYIWPIVKTGQGLIGQFSSVGGDDGTGGFGGSLVNVYTNLDSDEKIMDVIVQADPLDATPDDEYGFTETITYYYTGSQLRSFVISADSTLIFTDSTIIRTDRL